MIKAKIPAITIEISHCKSHHISYKNKKRRQVAPEDRVRIPGTHEALIDAETWASTQERLQSNTRVGKRSQELSPLSGKVRCAVCGRPMKRNVYYNKARTIQYYGLQCATYKTGAMNCPNRRTISGLVLEQRILDALNALVQAYCQADEIRLTDVHQEQLHALEKQLTALTERQQAAKSRLIAMYKDKLDGLLSDADYALFRESLTAEEASLAARTEELRQQITDVQKRQISAAGQQELIRKYTHFDRLDRSIADEFIDKVEIGLPEENGEREIHIHWKL
ncbi:MAG: recombinase zinc beta ribbon domain-containing protein [Oscillospiraceae bacterium]|nr:recombinase zinc beta ribbon domain-containing protein [Oscillospiraceae bacterium]